MTRQVCAFEIVSLEDDEVVDTIKVNPPMKEDSRTLERLERGLCRKVDDSRFFYREVYVPTRYILYHGRCLDGFGAAYAAWKKFHEYDEAHGERTEYIGVRYEEDPPELIKGVDVYIVDFSYKRDVLIELAKDHGITVIDHHKSAQEDLAGEIEVEAIFDLERSAAVMAWTYWHMEDPPKLLRHIGDRDLWRFEMKDTESICAALWHKDMDFEVWDQICTDKEQFKRLRYQGRMIIKVRDDNIRQANKGAFSATIDGHRCVVVNNPIHVSEAAHLLLKKFPNAQFAVCFRMQDDGRWRWDFRARKEGFDVSTIAIPLGGGGHPSAAGARTPDLIFTRLGD
jgi:nanoRNase/pAp phosphatase (c-di-AMP/oligoRNAs hydrolase)